MFSSADTLRRTPSAPLAALLVALIATACSSSNAGAPQGGEDGREVSSASVLPRRVELAALDVSLKLDSKIQQFTGTAILEIAAVSEPLADVRVTWHGPAMTRVADGLGRELVGVRDGDELVVELPEPVPPGATARLQFDFAGAPVRGVFFEGADSSGLGSARRAMFDASSGTRSGWLPVPRGVVDVTRARIGLELPAGWTSLGPGTRSGRVEEDGVVQEEWRVDEPTRLAWLGVSAGQFDSAELDAGSVVFEFMTQGNRREWLTQSLDESVEVLDYYSVLFGVPYGRDHYRQLCLPTLHGSSVVGGAVLPDRVLGDEAARRDADEHDVFARALARQWLGGRVLPEPGHLWLDRGLAAYAGLLYTETLRGADEFGLRLRDARAKSSQLNVALASPRADQLSPDVLEGLAVGRLHLLRKSIGDQAFFDGLEDYVQSSVGKRVTTSDFQAAMELATSSDLSGFFDDWFRRGGDAQLELDWAWDDKAGEVVLRVKQTHDPEIAAGAYRAPIEVEMRAGSRTVVQRIELERRTQSYRFPLDERPLWVRFDREGALPGRVTFDRRADEWLAIASRDLEPLGRAEAVMGLGDLARGTRDRSLRDLAAAPLGDRALHDDSIAVRSAAVTELGRLGGLDSRAWLEQVSERDPSAKVRVDALRALEPFGPSPELAAVAEARFREGYSWSTRAAAASLFVAAAPERASAWLAERLVIESPQERLRAALISELAELPGPEIDRLLLSWAGDRLAAESVRIAAINGISRREPTSAQLGEAIAQLLNTRERRVRLSVVEGLSRRSDSASRQALAAYAPRVSSSDEARAVAAAFPR